MGDLEKGGTYDTEKSRNQAHQTKHTCQCPLTGDMKVQWFPCTMLASNDCAQRHVSARAEAAREVGVNCSGSEKSGSRGRERRPCSRATAARVCTAAAAAAAATAAGRTRRRPRPAPRALPCTAPAASRASPPPPSGQNSSALQQCNQPAVQ